VSRLRIHKNSLIFRASSSDNDITPILMVCVFNSYCKQFVELYKYAFK
ncbi:hypothetical protein ALC56_08934, partial [Trachymyrmex septentrionalis]